MTLAKVSGVMRTSKWGEDKSIIPYYLKTKQIAYFERIAKIQTPKQIKSQYDDSYNQMCATYCVMRNIARDVSIGNLLEDIGRKKIKGLLKKINKLKKETIFEWDKKPAGGLCNFHRRQLKKLPFSEEWKIEKNLEVVFNDMG